MKPLDQFVTLSQGKMQYRFLTTGDVYYFGTEDLMVNQFHGTRLDGSANGIYLRLWTEQGPEVFPLVGLRSGSRFLAGEKTLRWQGKAREISYEVVFEPSGFGWLWRVRLEGKGDGDLICGQDLGVGSRWSITGNPLYNSQYLGHSVLEGKNGYVICSRQNGPIDGACPYSQLGVFGDRAVHFATDGLQFFGLQARYTGRPQALDGDLPDEILQYECAYGALQTERKAWDGVRELCFYGLFREDHPGAVTAPEPTEDLESAWLATLPEETLRPVTVPELRKDLKEDYCSEEFTPAEIRELFPWRKLEERDDNGLLSFFTPDHAHVVTAAKERRTLRSHGAILMSAPDRKTVSSNVLATTAFMGGVFNSHTVVGNTDMNQMLSNTKGFLNLQKNSGQRMYVKLDGAYRLLNLPGLFEIGLNYCRWFYKIGDDVLRITTFCPMEATEAVLEVQSQKNRQYDFLLTHQLIMGGEDYETEIRTEPLSRGRRFFLGGEVYPQLYYDILVPEGGFRAGGDEVFFQAGGAYDEAIFTLSLENRSQFRVVIRGQLEGGEYAWEGRDFETEKARGLAYYEDFMGGFRLTGGDPKRAEILNETALWYCENAMVHYAMPHGLEQSGGAAWGTRDVCQGPMELFLTTGHYELARNVLLRVFAHQDAAGEWPQWFMFDKYDMDAGECHGDVIFWPLLALGKYLAATGDLEILQETVPFAGGAGDPETILRHTARAVENVRTTRFLPGSYLVSYAGGDWDDTLQPADPKMRDHLVSAWTQALAYDTFMTLAPELQEGAPALAEELRILGRNIGEAFRKELIREGVIPGFLYREDEDRLLLHPEDKTTGLHYRLLPMTRSIISGLADPEQARRNETLMEDHLTFPDGVRLMDRPAAYDGGVSHLFQRAEQAANVGREISLQYTHAHIRYIEAMARLGRGEKAFRGLFTVNPILIQETVPNAALRQSNTYFSSSDGDFLNRYDYAERFELLRRGQIPVRAGWRLYSSGPGIYLRQVVENVLGIRAVKEGLVLDPVLPETENGLEFRFRVLGRSLTFRYHLEEGKRGLFCGGRALAVKPLENPYRPGGWLLEKQDLPQEGETLDVYL